MMNARVGIRLFLGICVLGAQAIAPLTAWAADLQEIIDRGYLIVAVKDNLQPLGFRDAEQQLQGLEIDLATRLAEDLLGDADAVRLIPVGNAERLSAVTSGDVDLAIANLTVTGPRSRLVDFSTPYYFDGTALVTNRVEVQSVTDLSGQSVAVLNHSSTIDVVRARIPNARLVGVDSYQAAYDLLEHGQAQAFAGDASVLTGWAQHDSDYRLLPTLLSASGLAIAMPKGLQYNSLRQQVNDAIAEWYAEGWLQERISYWGLPQ